MELGKKLVKEHPEVGDQGDITVYYTGNTYTVEQQEYYFGWCGCKLLKLAGVTKENLPRSSSPV